LDERNGIKPVNNMLLRDFVLIWSKAFAPHFRQITTPTPHHSFFYRPYALPEAQPNVKALKAKLGCIEITSK